MSDDELFDYYLYAVTLAEPVEEEDPFAEKQPPCLEVFLFFLLLLVFAVLSLFA